MGPTSACVYARLENAPSGETSENTNSATVQVSGSTRAAANGRPATAKARAAATAPANSTANPTKSPPTRLTGMPIAPVSWVHRLSSPISHAPPAAVAAAHAGTRGATNSTGNGASQTSQKSGVRPVPT